MHKPRRILVSTAAFIAVMTIPAAGVEAAPLTSPFTALTIDGSGDNPVLGSGQSLSFAGGAVSLVNAAGGVTVNAAADSVSVTPPTGGAFAVGSFTTLTVADASDYGLTVTVGGTVCATGAGTVTIEQVTTDGSDVTAFAASYTTSCGASTAPVAGEIRFDSTVDYVGAVQDSAAVDFGTADTGFPSASRTVTFTAVGSLPIVFGTAQLGGGDAASFAVTTDTCSGLAVASTCTVTVVAEPRKTGVVGATLTIPDNTTLGSRTVALAATGFVGGLGTFHPVPPARVIDTRTGNGPVGPKASITVPIAGHGMVPPSGVSAVVLNVTETNAKVGGYLVVYPAGAAQPNASNLNYVAGATRANSVTVALGTGGAVVIYNAGQSDLIVDVSGYFVGSDALAAGGQYNPVPPLRIFDSRMPGNGPLAYQRSYLAGYTFGNPAIDAHIVAFAVNITAVGPTAAGWLTAWNGQGAAPGASTVNFAKGATTPNMAIVPTSPCSALRPADACGVKFVSAPEIVVENFAHGNVNLIVDIVGFFDDGTLNTSFPGVFPGGRFHPVTSQRITDTRIGLGIPAALGPNETAAVAVPPTLADQFTMSLAMNVTAVGPTVATYLTLWAQGNRPTVSVLNPAAFQTVANATITSLPFGASQFDVWNAQGTTNFLADVAGFYEFDPASWVGPIPGAATTRERAHAMDLDRR